MVCLIGPWRVAALWGFFVCRLHMRRQTADRTHRTRLLFFCRLCHYILLQHLLQQHLLISRRFPSPVVHCPAFLARSHIPSPAILNLHCHHFAVFRILLLLPSSSTRHSLSRPFQLLSGTRHTACQLLSIGFFFVLFQLFFSIC